MPRGNVDEDLHQPKGQLLAGEPIGILCLAGSWMPWPPGCVNNASTWDFPVLYKVVEETRNWEIMTKPEVEEGHRFPPRLLDEMIEGAKELETQGVRAISGACGFFANFQKGVAAAVNVPVFLSSLCQISIIRQGLKPGQKIGIITFANLLGPRTFSEVGVDDISDLAIVGAEDYGEFSKLRTYRHTGHYNPFKVEQDLANLANRMGESPPVNFSGFFIGSRQGT